MEDLVVRVLRLEDSQATLEKSVAALKLAHAENRSEVDQLSEKFQSVSIQLSSINGKITGAAIVLGLIEPAIVAGLMKLFNL